jgi:hypothetical protein
VQDEDGVADNPVPVLLHRAEGAVVDPEFGQDFPGDEAEFAEDEVSLDRFAIICGAQGRGGEEDEVTEELSHRSRSSVMVDPHPDIRRPGWLRGR